MSQIKNALVCLTPSFISPLLLKTLDKYGISVHLSEKVKVNGYKLNLINQQEAMCLFDTKGKLYLNSEDSLDVIESKSTNKTTLEAIRFFKNKYVFKKCFQDNDSFLEQIGKDELDSFVPPENKHLIVKPSVGFHSLGIRDFTGLEQWKSVSREIVEEIDEFKEVFNEGVLSSARFIVEDYLQGVELAVDAYYNSSGKPVIVGVYEHPFKDEQDTRDLVYHTSVSLIQKYYDKVMELLNTIAENINLQNFPLHLEARIEGDKIRPIEGNPLRFGGFGLTDLTYHAFKINPYLMYFENKNPDWLKVLESEDENHYAFVIGQRPDDYDPRMHEIDHYKYRETFENIIDYRMVDPARYKFFSVVYAKSRVLEDLTRYLKMDFNTFKVSLH